MAAEKWGFFIEQKKTIAPSMCIKCMDARNGYIKKSTSQQPTMEPNGEKHEINNFQRENWIRGVKNTNDANTNVVPAECVACAKNRGVEFALNEGNNQQIFTQTHTHSGGHIKECIEKI